MLMISFPTKELNILTKLSSGYIFNVSYRLAPLASIADTSLDQKGGKVNENDVNAEFLVLITILLIIFYKLD